MSTLISTVCLICLHLGKPEHEPIENIKSVEYLISSAKTDDINPGLLPKVSWNPSLHLPTVTWWPLKLALILLFMLLFSYCYIISALWRRKEKDVMNKWNVKGCITVNMKACMTEVHTPNLQKYWVLLREEGEAQEPLGCLETQFHRNQTIKAVLNHM